MGLDVSHDAFHGSYTMFNHWRSEVWKAAGGTVVVDEEGDPAPDLPWDEYEERNYEGDWSEPPDDPLLVLM
ncbi:MAG TPA: hypothetical protein VKA30_02260, partial [Actinomycetota bacterium]|nr:hypothetical protein [Actinomycetota bacterium]